MIVFAAHVPHSPLLMKSISGDRIGAVRRTLDALEELADELYARHVQTIVLLSDHPTMYDEALSMNVADPYHCDLHDVGDLGYKATYHPDFALVDRLQRELRKAEQPFTLTTDDRLHFAAAVPLEFLTRHQREVRLVPIAPAGRLSPKEHFAFGQALKHTLTASSARIAVISAGDLAHTLTEFAPGGYHEEGATFDELVQTLIREKNTVGLLQIDEALRHAAQEAAYLKLVTLFGTLDGMAVQPEILSYEAPFGVGYLVTHFPIA